MFELVEEMFRATKPGLSSFADEPQKVLFKNIYLHKILLPSNTLFVSMILRMPACLSIHLSY